MWRVIFFFMSGYYKGWHRSRIRSILIIAAGVAAGVVGAAGAGNETCVVPKCCPPGQSLAAPDSAPGAAPGAACVASRLRFEPGFWDGAEAVAGGPDDPLDVIEGDPCQYGKFRLEPSLYSADEFHVLCNGSMLAPFHSDQLYSPGQYCLEAFPAKAGAEEADSVTLPLLCFPPPPPPPTVFDRMAAAVYPVGLLVSVPFLALTVAVFTAIPELRDTPGKSLASHCCCLAAAYVSLAANMIWGDRLPHPACVALAFIIQLSFVSCFFWLNVLCIDTWWRLTRRPSWSGAQERARFAWYSLYAWAAPLVLVLVSIFMELAPIVPEAYVKPNFGVQSCWFYSRDSALPYFYGPIGLLLATNVCLFWLSAGAVRAAAERRAEEEVGLDEPPPDDANRPANRIRMFKQCLVLFLVMGLNWCLELASYLAGGPIELWLLTDTLNTLQGVIIYLVFVVRVPRVKRLANERLLPFWCQRHHWRRR